MSASLRLKRFFDSVSFDANKNGDFVVYLDGKPLKTKAGNTLALPSKKLAQAIKEEWEGQHEEVNFVAMPLTRIAFGILDLSEEELDSLREEISSYGETDMLCYHADLNEDCELAKRQQQIWQPFLNWAYEHLDLNMKTTSGIMPINQDEKVLQRIKDNAGALSKWQAVPISILVQRLGSYILAESVRHGFVSAADAAGASALDADYQAERWGHDDEAKNSQRDIAEDIINAASFLNLLNDDIENEK